MKNALDGIMVRSCVSEAGGNGSIPGRVRPKLKEVAPFLCVRVARISLRLMRWGSDIAAVLVIYPGNARILLKNC